MVCMSVLQRIHQRPNENSGSLVCESAIGVSAKATAASMEAILDKSGGL